MRVVQNYQMQIGEIDISKMTFDLKSHDDITKILSGLQHLYMDLALRTKLFALLEQRIALKANKRCQPCQPKAKMSAFLPN
jgi:transposase, IS5 family